jgi:hypothetical protein
VRGEGEDDDDEDEEEEDEEDEEEIVVVAAQNRRRSITRQKITVSAFHEDCCNLKNASYIISSSLNPCSCCIHSSKNEIRFGGFMYKLFSFWIHHFFLLLREV